MFPISQDSKTQNQVASLLLIRELRRLENGEPSELERRAQKEHPMTPSNPYDGLMKLLNSDHKRLCEGREYTCTCGFDDERDTACLEALSRLEELVTVVAQCRDKFAEYSRLHFAKVPSANTSTEVEAIMEKVQRNREMAEMCDATLTRLSRPTDLEEK